MDKKINIYFIIIILGINHNIILIIHKCESKGKTTLNMKLNLRIYTNISLHKKQLKYWDICTFDQSPLCIGTR